MGGDFSWCLIFIVMSLWVDAKQNMSISLIISARLYTHLYMSGSGMYAVNSDKIGLCDLHLTTCGNVRRGVRQLSPKL